MAKVNETAVVLEEMDAARRLAVEFARHLLLDAPTVVQRTALEQVAVDGLRAALRRLDEAEAAFYGGPRALSGFAAALTDPASPLRVAMEKR